MVVISPPDTPQLDSIRRYMLRAATGDDQKYHEITQEGSGAYADMWYGGRRLFADDFATVALGIKNTWDYVNANYANPSGKPQVKRAVEPGMGSILISAIIGAPVVEEYIGIERSPANIETAKNDLTGEPKQHWESWREITAILYARYAEGIDPVTWMHEQQTGNTEIYQAFCDWNSLSPGRKEELLAHYASVEEGDNPYLGQTTQVLLRDKVKFVLGDAINKVEGDPASGLADLRPLAGTADMVFANYYFESVQDTPFGTTHAMRNAAALARKGGLLQFNFMEGSLEYGGFGISLKECYGTTRVFAAIFEAMADPINRQDRAVVDHNAEGVEVARGNYTGVASAAGICKGLDYENTRTLLQELHFAHRDIVLVKVGERFGVCFKDEAQGVCDDMLRIYNELVDRGIEGYKFKQTAATVHHFNDEIMRGAAETIYYRPIEGREGEKLPISRGGHAHLLQKILDIAAKEVPGATPVEDIILAASIRVDTRKITMEEALSGVSEDILSGESAREISRLTRAREGRIEAIIHQNNAAEDILFGVPPALKAAIIKDAMAKATAELYEAGSLRDYVQQEAYSAIGLRILPFTYDRPLSVADPVRLKDYCAAKGLSPDMTSYNMVMTSLALAPPELQDAVAGTVREAVRGEEGGMKFVSSGALQKHVDAALDEIGFKPSQGNEKPQVNAVGMREFAERHGVPTKVLEGLRLRHERGTAEERTVASAVQLPTGKSPSSRGRG